MDYDKVFVKIEDKKECKKLKNCLKDRYKVALYTGDSKEVKLNEDGIFEEDVDVVISTSSIQNGQSIKEKVLSIFVQTYIGKTSSVEQFLGRNRNRDSNVYVHARYGKHMNKRKYVTPNNRYERRWNEMSKKIGMIYYADSVVYDLVNPMILPPPKRMNRMKKKKIHPLKQMIMLAIREPKITQ
ncbi:hypothetical protein M9Y10_019239 [Tritrichomonas musculus]|uniref:Helicase C-terminal domain-containing protein n=1 Tax=Tritrichomonas musculus TaxID=1915356 RepID=A0ABR2HIZ8_9EUKA